MKIWNKLVLFSLGGGAYVALELLWRGKSHSSMFLAGGTCFLLLGGLRRTRLPAAVRPLAGAALITAVELAAGLAVNRSFAVWDYRDLPLNFLGQVCLPYSLLWVPLSAGAMGLHSLLERYASASCSSRARAVMASGSVLQTRRS